MHAKSISLSEKLRGHIFFIKGRAAKYYAKDRGGQRENSTEETGAISIHIFLRDRLECEADNGAKEGEDKNANSGGGVRRQGRGFHQVSGRNREKTHESVLQNAKG